MSRTYFKMYFKMVGWVEVQLQPIAFQLQMKCN